MATGEDQSWMANKKREFMDVSSPKYGNFIGFDLSPYGLIMFDTCIFCHVLTKKQSKCHVRLVSEIGHG